MFQYRFVRIFKFGWWYLEKISVDADTKFTSTEFQDKCQTCGAYLKLAAPEYQEINGKVEVTWRASHTITPSLMVHARVLELIFILH